MATIKEDDWITADEAGEILGTSGAAVRYHIREGKLQAQLWGGRIYRIKRGDLKKIKYARRGRPPRAEKVTA
jgi:excisionase family DNA binding protein